MLRNQCPDGSEGQSPLEINQLDTVSGGESTDCLEIDPQLIPDFALGYVPHACET